jgi:hypothetical protein
MPEPRQSRIRRACQQRNAFRRRDLGHARIFFRNCAGSDNTDLRSNTVAGNQLIDIGQPTISSVAQRPRSDDTFHPVVTGEINYTFGNGWQAFFGTSLEDAITLDGVTQLGARKDLGTAGIVQGGFLFSGIPTQVWEDPYAEGVRRQDTDRDSTGLRLQWDRILGTAFELTFSYRDISIDTERSGQGVTSVACDAACRDLLRRDGDQYHFDASYLFRLGQGQRHLVRAPCSATPLTTATVRR